MKDTLQYVFSNLSQAHSTLIDPDTRDEYEASVREGQKRTSLAPRPSNEAEVRDALEAENLHQKTLVFMKRGQYKEAMELIERVRLLNPKEGEYIATWAFLQGHARQRGLPLDDLIERLRQALTLNPNSERIMLYLAKMLERVGHDTESRVFYKRVLKLNPSNIEAGRAVRLMEMRDRKEQEKGKSKGFLKKIFGEKP
jgi:tetratricopeptide (TPR) repeat protein